MQWAKPNTYYFKIDNECNQYSSQKSQNSFEEFCAGVLFIWNLTIFSHSINIYQDTKAVSLS